MMRCLAPAVNGLKGNGFALRAGLAGWDVPQMAAYFVAKYGPICDQMRAQVTAR